MVENRGPTLPRRRVTLGLAFAAFGLVPALIGLGVVQLAPDQLFAPLWVVLVIGMAFMSCGVATAIGSQNAGANVRWLGVLQYIAVLLVIASLASISSWVAFGPGERQFTSGGGISISSVAIESEGDSGERLGRAVFGFGAIVTWLCLAVMVVQGVRTLTGRRDRGPSSK